MDSGGLNLLTNGQTVFERYRLKMLVGRGAMGLVWRAHDQELEIDIALKFLAENFLFDTGAIADLKRETRRGMALAHPHIVRIFGFFHTGQHAAIAMEYVEGNSLASLQASRSAGCFEVAEIAEWTRQLCSALHYAHHEAELIHRDLKPGNLMIDARGRLKVADFGIASGIGDLHTRLAAGGDSRGTPSYMSPQQLLGQAPCISHDIYALGATLYDLLTGRPPFHRGDVSLQARTVVPPGIAERRAELGLRHAPIPPEWEETIAACLAKEAADRPESAAHVAARLGLGPVDVTFGPPSRASNPAPTETPAPTLVTVSPSAPTRFDPPRSNGTSPAPATVGAVIVGTRNENTSHAADLKRPLLWMAGGAAIAAASVLIAVGAIVWFLRQPRGTPPEPERESAIAPARPAEPAGAPREPEAAPPREDGLRGGPEDFERPGEEGPDGERRPPPPPPRAFLPDGPRATLDHPEPEHPFVLPGSGIAMQWISRGNGVLGTPPHARGRPAHEHPITPFTLSEGFWLGKHEVSRGEFSAIMGYDPSAYPSSGDSPVGNVSWEEAAAFCAQLTLRERAAKRLPEGYAYTLPTEGQWEYAAAAATIGRFGPHTQNLREAAWGAFSGVSAPQPRGRLAANPWGLHDMLGNVAEWCLDWYERGHPGEPVTDYAGPAAGTQRLYKGGTYADTEYLMHISARTPLDPGARDPRVGFRLALVRVPSQH